MSIENLTFFIAWFILFFGWWSVSVFAEKVFTGFVSDKAYMITFFISLAMGFIFSLFFINA